MTSTRLKVAVLTLFPALGMGTALYETDYQYNALNETVALVNSSAVQKSVVSSFAYSYNPDAKVASLSKTYGTISSTKAYTYDALGRLVSGSRHDYAFDLQNNLRQDQAPSDTLVRTYNLRNELTAITGLRGGHSQEFVYDGAGNMVSNSGGISYAYNALNQITDINDNHYSYDGNGNRFSMTINGTIQSFYYANSVLMNTTSSSYLLGMNREGYFDNATPYFYEYNLHGDVVNVMSANGSSKPNASYDYTAYGQDLMERNSTDTNLFGYGGGLLNADGSYSYGIRNYNVDAAIFNQQDPTLFAATGNILNLNNRLFVNGDPVNKVDPSGRYGVAIAASIAGTVVVSGLIYSYRKLSMLSPKQVAIDPRDIGIARLEFLRILQQKPNDWQEYWKKMEESLGFSEELESKFNETESVSNDQAVWEMALNIRLNNEPKPLPNRAKGFLRSVEFDTSRNTVGFTAPKETKAFVAEQLRNNNADGMGGEITRIWGDGGQFGSEWRDKSVSKYEWYKGSL